MKLNELLIYNRWAEDHFFDIIQDLDPELHTKEIMGKTLKGIIFHFYAVYWSWYHIMTDQDFSDEPNETMSISSLIIEIHEIYPLIVSLANKDEGGTSEVQWEKHHKVYRATNYSIIQNFINHSSYHRGQLALILSQIGVEVIGDTDINPYNYQNFQNQ